MVTAGMRSYPNDGVPSVDFPIYSRGNVGEAFPDVISPMSGSLMLDASARSQVRFFLAAGAISKAQLRDPRNALFAQFWGYLYTNVSMARIAAVRAPGMALEEMDSQFAGVGVLPPYVPRRGDRSLTATIRLARYAARALALGDARRARTAQGEVDAWIASLAPVSNADDDELLARVRMTSWWFDRLNHEMMTVTLHAGSTRVMVERLSAAAGQPDAANAITSGLGDVASAGPAVALWDLGRQARDPAVSRHFDSGERDLETRLRNDAMVSDFVTEFDRLLADYGFHGTNELELSAPKWQTDPHLVLRIVDRLRHAPDERDPRRAAARLASRRTEATDSVASDLPRVGRRLFRRVVRHAGIYAREREATKAALVRALLPSRLALDELARRHAIAPGDIYLLVDGELEPALTTPDAYAALIAERRALRGELQQRQPPFWFDGTIPHPDAWPPRPVDGGRRSTASTLQGLGVSSGTATGRARVILDPHDPVGLEPDDILIARETDPAWTPLFLAAAGVVVEYGAVMSHAAIVARELGVPAVVGVGGATSEIGDGTTVTIDGTAGTVTLS